MPSWETKAHTGDDGWVGGSIGGDGVWAPQMFASISRYDVVNPSVHTKEKHRAAARRHLDRSSVPPGSVVGPGSEGWCLIRNAVRSGRLPLSPLCLSRSASAAEHCSHVRRTACDVGPPIAPSCSAARRRELGRELPAISQRVAKESHSVWRTHRSGARGSSDSRAMHYAGPRILGWDRRHLTLRLHRTDGAIGGTGQGPGQPTLVGAWTDGDPIQCGGRGNLIDSRAAQRRQFGFGRAAVVR